MRRGAGAMRERLGFDVPLLETDALGRNLQGWSPAFEAAAEAIFERGNEAVDAARLTGRALFKFRLRSSVQTRRITPGWRMRDLRRGTVWNVRSVDAISDPAHVWLQAEAGVAS